MNLVKLNLHILNCLTLSITMSDRFEEDSEDPPERFSACGVKIRGIKFLDKIEYFGGKLYASHRNGNGRIVCVFEYEAKSEDVRITGHNLDCLPMSSVTPEKAMDILEEMRKINVRCGTLSYSISNPFGKY